MGMKRQAERKANEYSRSQSFLFLFVSKALRQELVLRPHRLRGTGGLGTRIASALFSPSPQFPPVSSRARSPFRSSRQTESLKHAQKLSVQKGNSFRVNYL